MQLCGLRRLFSVHRQARDLSSRDDESPPDDEAPHAHVAVTGPSARLRRRVGIWAAAERRGVAQKLIIDTDPGIGDAVAIAIACFDPGIDLLAVTAVAGCVSGPIASRNIQAIIENLDPPKWPRIGTSDHKLALPSYTEGDVTLLHDLNGTSGLGDFEFQVADLHHRHESAKLMIDVARSLPHEVTLLTLGPLSNVELACERAPDFLSLLKGVVCLGGSVAHGGDVSPAAEFNMFANPHAARSVLLSPATKTLVPLDVSARTALTFEQFDSLPKSDSSPAGRFLGQILPYAFRAYHQHLGVEGIRLAEVTALAAISHSRLFDSQPMAVDIETSGRLTRGATVFDRRGVSAWQNNIDVLLDVDTQGILDYFTRTVR